MPSPLDPRSHEAGPPAVALRRMFPHAEFLGGRDLLASGASSDPRGIRPGQVFLAAADTAATAPMAIERGAVGVVTERPIADVATVQVVVGDVRSAAARIGQALAGDPSEALPVIAITGGPAAEAIALFLEAILEAAGRRVGVLGPEEAADASSMASGLARRANERCDVALVRPSDRALDARVMDGVSLAGVIYAGDGPTGPADEPDRLGLRRTARLVRSLRPGGILAIDAQDAEAGLLLGSNLDAIARTFALDGPADLSAEILRGDLNGSQLRLLGLDRERSVSLAPIGEEAIRAALAASALARELGASDGAIVAGLESICLIPGRLEPIARGLHPRVFADRSAEASGVAASIGSLRRGAVGDVVCVLAAHSMNARAAEVVSAVEKGCDRVVLTASPAEPAPTDLAPWLGHFRRPGRVRVLHDRRSALHAALDDCRPGDVVLLLGPTLDHWQADADILRAWAARRISGARRSA